MQGRRCRGGGAWGEVHGGTRGELKNKTNEKTIPVKLKLLGHTIQCLLKLSFTVMKDPQANEKLVFFTYKCAGYSKLCVFSCTNDGSHRRANSYCAWLLVVPTYPRSPFPAHCCGVSESTICSPLRRTTTLTGRWAAKIRTINTHTHSTHRLICV